MYYLPVAAVTNYHEPSVLKQHMLIILEYWWSDPIGVDELGSLLGLQGDVCFPMCPASRGTCTPCPLASSAFKTSQSSSAPSQVTLCPPAPVCLPQAPSDYTGPFLMIQGSHTSRVSWPEILIPSATLIPLCPES